MTDTPNHLDELVEADRTIAELREEIARLTPVPTEHRCGKCGGAIWTNEATVIDRKQFGDDRQRHFTCVMIHQRDGLRSNLDAAEKRLADVRERLRAIVAEAEHCDLPHVSSAWVIRCVRAALAAADGRET